MTILPEGGYNKQVVRVPAIKWNGAPLLFFFRKNGIRYEIEDVLSDNSTMITFNSSRDFERACSVWECLTGVRRIGYLPYKQFIN